MDIGEEEKGITIEPVIEPTPNPSPAPAEPKRETPEPLTVPERELIPA